MDDLENDLELALLLILAALLTYESIRTIRYFLEKGQIENILIFINEKFKEFSNKSIKGIIDVGLKEAKSLEPKLKRYLGRSVVVTFDPSKTDLIDRINRNFLYEIENVNRHVVYEVINRGLIENRNSAYIAKEIAKSIGLNKSQEEAVRNYKRLLEEGSKEAFRRELRDKSFDNVNILDEKTIDRMVDQYRKNYILHRAKTIAQTESGRIVSEVQDEVLRQVVLEYNIPENDVVRTWRTIMDGKQRDTHSALNGAQSQLNGYFTTFMGNRLRYPRDPQAPASEIINCRCGITINFHSHQN